MVKKLTFITSSSEQSLRDFCNSVWIDRTLIRASDYAWNISEKGANYGNLLNDQPSNSNILLFGSFGDLFQALQTRLHISIHVLSEIKSEFRENAASYFEKESEAAPNTAISRTFPWSTWIYYFFQILSKSIRYSWIQPYWGREQGRRRQVSAATGTWFPCDRPFAAPTSGTRNSSLRLSVNFGFGIFSFGIFTFNPDFSNRSISSILTAVGTNCWTL